MKKLRNAAIIILLLIGISSITLSLVYKSNTDPVDANNKEKIEFTVKKGETKKTVGENLQKAGLIKNSTFFQIYLKLYPSKDFKATKYYLSKDMSLKEIINVLEEGNSNNEDQIKITFKEGITMRKIAEVIAKETNNKEEDVINKSNDTKYIDTLIEKYWFITDTIKNDKLYYKLEGYLYPDTYYFMNKDVTVEEIFNTMIKKMEKELAPYREEIAKSKYSVHEIITLASIIEKETPNNDTYRANVARVFYNRLEKNINLGSDVTTYYALKIDNVLSYIEKNCAGGKNCVNYNVVSPYNTRIGDGTMNGKLPVGPISTISLGSIKAAVYPSDNNNLYFISNIETKEMFFYSNYSDFLKKKAELDKINGGI